MIGQMIARLLTDSARTMDKKQMCEREAKTAKKQFSQLDLALKTVEKQLQDASDNIPELESEILDSEKQIVLVEKDVRRETRIRKAQKKVNEVVFGRSGKRVRGKLGRAEDKLREVYEAALAQLADMGGGGHRSLLDVGDEVAPGDVVDTTQPRALLQDEESSSARSPTFSEVLILHQPVAFLQIKKASPIADDSAEEAAVSAADISTLLAAEHKELQTSTDETVSENVHSDEDGAPPLETSLCTQKHNNPAIRTLACAADEWRKTLLLLENIDENLATKTFLVQAQDMRTQTLFEKYTAEQKLLREQKLRHKEGLKRKLKKLETLHQNLETDWGEKKKELEKHDSYIVELKQTCPGGISPEELKAKRESEVAALKRALGVLTGEEQE